MNTLPRLQEMVDKLNTTVFSVIQKWRNNEITR
jgi:hypothetical protein